MTVKELADLLASYPEDSEVRTITLDVETGISHLEEGVTDEGTPCCVIMSDEQDDH